MKAPSLDRLRALEALLRTRSPSTAAAELGVARSTATKTLRTPLTLERYLSAGHVTMMSHNGNAIVDAALAHNGYQRRVLAQVPHLAALLQAAETQGLCATLPVRVVLAMRPAKLFVHTPPVAIPDRRVMLTWHRECDQDPDNRWLRGVMMSASQR